MQKFQNNGVEVLRLFVQTMAPLGVDLEDCAGNVLRQLPGSVGADGLILASPKAGFITGENICIDGGQTRLMIYHGDHGWSLQ